LAAKRSRAKSTAVHYRIGVNLQSGDILVAHPRTPNGPWAKTVVVLTEVHSQGAVGLIVNKSAGYSFSDCVDIQNIANNPEIFIGGPVNRSALIMLHSNEWYSQNTMQIGRNMAISSDPIMVEKLAGGNEPVSYRLMAGICGWGPNQLQEECKRENGWLTIPGDPHYLFTSKPEHLWQRAVGLVTQSWVNTYF
jgi:putative transcriptional regulator